MSKYFLLGLKIFAALAVAITGILGIIGESSDKNGNLTQYGRINLFILLGALIIAVITSIVEHYNEEQKEREEKRLLADNVNRQNKILSDIKRSFYAITSIDIEITCQMLATSKFLGQYKLKLDEYINCYSIDKNQANENRKDNHTQILLELDDKLNSLTTVYGIKIKGNSPLYPKEDNLAEIALTPSFYVLITSSIDFKELDYSVIKHRFSIAALDKVSDIAMLASTTHFDDSSTIVYSALESTFYVNSIFKNAAISHDNGKIESILDLKNKYIVLYEDSFIAHKQIDEFKVREFKIQFNKSESKNHSSFFIIKGDQFKVLQGLDWYALYFQINEAANFSNSLLSFLKKGL